MSRKTVIPVLGAVCGLLAAMGAPATWADDFKLVPTGSLKEEFNDNIFFASAAPRSSFITTPSAGLTLLDSTERFSAVVNARLDGLLYSAQSSLNGLEQRYGAQATYLLTQQLQVGATAGFSRESRPDRLDEATGLVVMQQSSRQEYGVTGSAALTEKLTGQLFYAYDWTDYHDRNVSNVAGHSARAVIAYDLGGYLPNLKLRGVAGFTRYRYAAAAVGNYHITAGISYPLHELWAVQGDVGGRLTHADFTGQALDASGSVSPARPNSDRPGWIANLTLSYRGETDTAALTFSKDVQNAAGRSGAVEAMALSLHISRRFTQEFSGSMGGGYHRNTSAADEFATLAIDHRSLTLHPSLRYEPTPDIGIDLSYDFAWVEDHRARTEAQRNKIFICVTMKRIFSH